MKLKEIREKHGLMQEDVASVLGISPANYSKKESGKVKVSLDEAKKLSMLFGETIDVIFFSDEVSKNETESEAV